MLILDQSSILSKLKELQPIFKKEHVNLLGLFGSYSRNEAKEDSDIDILIETTPEFLKNNRGFSAFSKLDELRDILKQSLGKNIDIVDKQCLLDYGNTFILKKTIYV
ncbi:MAG: nucleotidyltransferase domain-containing protein [Campylobacterota bacterium]|nr:nucleotidyltransferase domain-containing protein [Campylobacterota bacterium]